MRISFLANGEMGEEGLHALNIIHQPLDSLQQPQSGLTDPHGESLEASMNLLACMV